MGRKLDPTRAKDKWVRNLSGATEDIRAGINAVTESPTAKAAAAKDKWFAKIQIAQQEDRFAKGLLRVSLADWKKAAIEKGVNRIAGGAVANQDKMEKFMKDFLPFVETVRDKVQAMPSTTFEDNIQRMIANARGLKEFKRT